MTAEMENSFFSLAFIYTLIKKPFAHSGMAARGIGQRPAGELRGQTRDSRWTKAREARASTQQWAGLRYRVVTTLGKVSGWGTALRKGSWWLASIRYPTPLARAHSL